MQMVVNVILHLWLTIQKKSGCKGRRMYVLLLYGSHINHINGTSQLRREKATGKKGPATALELGTYALSRSFSHASHGDRPRSFVPHRPYVPVW